MASRPLNRGGEVSISPCQNVNVSLGLPLSPGYLSRVDSDKETSVSHEENRLEPAPGSQEAISALEERVFTIDPRTGQLVKVQKVDRSGQLRELSHPEYVSLVAGYPPLVLLGLLVVDFLTLKAAYDQGVEDCRTWWQLACSGYWSSEEQAYYQGVVAWLWLKCQPAADVPVIASPVPWPLVLPPPSVRAWG